MSKPIITSGSRKQAVARATLKKGKGNILINNVPIDQYEPKIAKLRIQTPLILADEDAKKVDIAVRVQGGGVTSQAEAVALAIGRALVEFNGKLEEPFQEYDRRLLVADVRRKESRKPNKRGSARATRQKSYR